MESFNRNYIASFGDWNIKLNASTPEVDDPVKKFLELIRNFDLEACDNCNIQQTFYVSTAAFLDNRSWLQPIPEDDELWRQFSNEVLPIYRDYVKHNRLDQDINPFTGTNFYYSWPGDWSNQLSSANSIEPERISLFVINVLDEQTSKKLWGVLFFQAMKWYIRQGGICAHSCGINRYGKGFLFLGPSEAGKTTIAQISSEIGDFSLGDDLNFIFRHEEDFYITAAPTVVGNPVGYSSLRTVLRGIFRIIQDDFNKIVPISSSYTAQLLFNAFYSQSPYTKRLSDPYMAHAFKVIGELARTIPAYELHFRKSPDFWKLIDAEFSD